jgi:hypothetical protein
MRCRNGTGTGERKIRALAEISTRHRAALESPTILFRQVNAAQPRAVDEHPAAQLRSLCAVDRHREARAGYLRARHPGVEERARAVRLQRPPTMPASIA